MKRYLLTIFCIAVSLLVWAEDLKFDSNKKYRIESIYVSGSSITIGANHSVNSPLCIERYTENATEADCFWYFEEKGNGTYAIRNASTNQYMTLDDQYVNSPEILRYMHLSSSLEDDASLWYIKVTQNGSYGETFYFQNVYNSNYFFNLRTGTYVIGAYAKATGAIPDGINELFRIYDEKGKLYTTDNGWVDPIGPVDPDDEEDTDSTALLPINGPVLHVYRADGKVDAIPEEFIASRTINSSGIEINTINGNTYSYAPYEVDSVCNTVPEMPKFLSFKFNNKFNHHIIDDAPGVFVGDTLITASVVGIGKTLRPSFKLDDDVQAWIGNKVQESKVSNPRFAHDVTYTVARRGYTILRQTLDSTFVTRPYGQETKVHVVFASDSSNATYGVPTVYIKTNDGSMISSKAYYWDATISIDGAGVFPDMEETAMQIKGRGNTSWAGTWGKSPYHIKFSEAVKPFGLSKGKHWNLIANAQTHSMTTNAVAMKMAQLVETAGFNHEIPIELYINGQYRGSYNFTEKVGFANNSIDLDNETYAVMFELDLYYDEAYKFRSSQYSLPVNIKEPDFAEATTPLTMDMIQASFNRVTDALANRENMSYYIDLDYLAKFLFVDEFTANFELMHPKSTFCYNPNVMDSDSKLIFGPCWDFDWGYGYCNNFDYFTSYDTVDYWLRSDGSGYRWVYQQRYCGSNFDKIYYNLWYDFVKNGKLEELIDFCDDYYHFAAKSFSHDNTQWGRGDAKTYANVTTNAKKWLRTRAEYILDYMTNTLEYGSKNYLTSTLSPALGDVNGDGRVTTADIVCVLNHILGLPNEEFKYTQADIDTNDMITIADLLAIRNLIPATKSNAFFGLPEAEANIMTEPVSATPEGVTIPLSIQTEEGQYCGIQFDLKIPAGMTIEDLDISQSIPDFDVSIAPLGADEYLDNDVDRYRVSIYSSANHVVPAGVSKIYLELGWGSSAPANKMLSATMANVMFVNTLGEDERAVSRSAQFCAEDLTGIHSAVSLSQQGNHLSVRSNETTTLPIYSTDGRIFRVYQLNAGTQNINLPAGIYIINKQKVVIH